MNDSTEIKLTPECVLRIGLVGLSGVREDLEVSFSRIDEHGFREGDPLRLGAMTREKDNDEEYTIWSYKDNPRSPEAYHPGKRQHKDAYWMAINQLQEIVTAHLESAFTNEELGFSGNDWYYENRGRVMYRLEKLFSRWLDLSHRGFRDVDDDVTLPTLWD